ncbi:MAG: 2-oxoacid:acceptor oxidoreductase family protein, partial [Bdellovibrionales bacterium]|nr:2-oxoacid:acceptor oxidoreductase family protein [Bdellovibrionales bacterium]
MTNTINNFVLQVATINGSGSQSANNALVKTLFRMGIPVTGKNMFPSNIAGLPTWFNIRAQSEGFTARKEKCDILVAMNPISIVADQKSLVSGGYCFFNEEINLTDNQKRQDVQYIPIPFKSIVEKLTDSGKLKKLLVNMIYVGVLSELLHLDQLQLNQVIRDLFGNKEKVVDLNLEALKAGLTWARENLKTEDFPFKAQVIPEGNKGKILIDGNSAAALGWVFGGCTMAAWYPITPSSSLVESFQKFSQKYRRDEEGNSRAAIVQAEDELSSICMVLGAGWAGARSATATSGPGLSLMSEAAGFAYFAEIPAVIWNVQRGGPSTGLPTRTQQADLQAAYRLSHGDTQHVLLLPAN